MLEAVLLKLQAKLAPGWVLIPVNFHPIQETGPKVGGGHSFVSGPFFARLQYRDFVPQAQGGQYQYFPPNWVLQVILPLECLSSYGFP